MEDVHSVATMERSGSGEATESPLQSPEMATKWPLAEEIAEVGGEG
jgi:hypothetical protein